MTRGRLAGRGARPGHRDRRGVPRGAAAVDSRRRRRPARDAHQPRAERGRRAAARRPPQRRDDRGRESGRGVGGRHRASGMSEEVRLRAHEPFFTTKGVKATGLGLSVAFGIARRHGGELSVQSEEGHGTTVRVTLPVAVGLGNARAAAGLRRSARFASCSSTTRRRSAWRWPRCCWPAGPHGADGRRRQRGARHIEDDPGIDLVLTDLVMPGMTGWELAGAVQRAPAPPARRRHHRLG